MSSELEALATEYLLRYLSNMSTPRGAESKEPEKRKVGRPSKAEAAAKDPKQQKLDITFTERGADVDDELAVLSI